MAARKNKLGHTPYDRNRIQVGLLVKLLNDHAEGRVELTPTRLKAIEILLKKSMPDLSATEITNTEQPIRYYAELPQKAQDVDAWAKDMADRAQPDATLRIDDGANPADQALTKDSTTKH